MVGKYKVITLCGSTRFKNEFMDMQKKLTLEGNIVISVGSLVIPEIRKSGRTWMKARSPEQRKCWMTCINAR